MDEGRTKHKVRSTKDLSVALLIAFAAIGSVFLRAKAEIR